MSREPELSDPDLTTVDIDDERFDEIARRAGEALRRPAPEARLRDVINSGRRRQQVRTALAGGAVALVLGAGALAWISRSKPHPVTTVDSVPDVTQVTDNTPITAPSNVVTLNSNALVTGLIFTDDGRRVLTTDLHGVRTFDVSTGAAIAYAAAPAQTFGPTLTPSPSGAFVATSSDGVTHMFDGVTRSPLYTIDSDSPPILSRDGTRLATSQGVLDAVTGSALLSLTTKAKLFALSDDGSQFSTSDGLGVKVWKVNTPQVATIVDVGNLPTSLHFSPDSGRLFVTRDRSDFPKFQEAGLLVWDVANRTQLAFIPGLSWSGEMPVNQDGSEIMLVNRFASPDLWDVATGTRISTGFSVKAYGGAFSPDGRFVAAIGDSAMQIVDTATNKVVLSVGIPSAGRQSFFDAVAFSPDSRRIAYTNGGDISIADLPAAP
jgi:WD40 repeat protein